MSKRTDIHSPSNFIPEDYRYLFSFCNGHNQLTFGFPINNDLIVKLRHQRGRDFANIHGGNYTCDICGHDYNEGEVWEHIANKELITLGHMCAMKYSLCADDQEFEREKAQAILKRKRQVEREYTKGLVKDVLEANEGLEAALETDHYIVKDIKNRLDTWGNISERQIALVMKLHKEASTPKVEENWIEVPVEGRTTIRGTVLGEKFEDTPFGMQHKMLVKVETDNGNWKTWGTVPSNLSNVWLDEDRTITAILVGSVIEFDAKVVKSDRDNKFSFFSRPTKASFIKAVEKKVF